MEAALMSDERRLLEGGASDFEAELLRAGRRDAPSSASRSRIVAGVMAGALVPSVVTLSAGASVVSWLQRAARSTAVRVGLGGTVGAAAIWGGVTLSQSEPQAVTAPAPPSAAVSAKVPVLAPPSTVTPQESSAPATEEERTTASDTSGARRAAADSSPLAEELAFLERARRALVRGESRRSLRLLDEYSRRFAKPRLSSEATVLRIEALVASGERARATQLGQQFLASHPNGPYERRIRSLIESKERAKNGL
jgi:hypothetical protein